MNLTSFIENLPLSKNTPLPDDLKEQLQTEVARQAKPYKNIAGIYFLFNEDEIVYIGQSVAVHTRIHKHVIEGIKVFDSFTIVEMPDYNQRLLREKQLIETFKPKHNNVLLKDLGFGTLRNQEERLGLNYWQMLELIKKHKVMRLPGNQVHIPSLEKAFEAEGGKPPKLETNRFKHPSLFE